MSRSLLVVGTHRSGTSLVAGMLSKLGVFVGDDLLGPSDANPKGHFEDREFLALNDEIVRDWKRPNSAISGAQRAAMRALVEEREAAYPVWAVKDPRLCLTAKHLVPMLDEPRFVLTDRDPRESAESLSNRDGLSVGHAELIQRRYLRARRALLDAFSEVPQLWMTFEGTLNSPREAAAALRDFAFPLEEAVGFVGV